MDEATEDLEMIPEAAVSDENQESLLSAENLNLDSAAEFNLDEVLDNEEAASFELPQNSAGEEENTADSDEKDWLAGIAPNEEDADAEDIGFPQTGIDDEIAAAETEEAFDIQHDGNQDMVSAEAVFGESGEEFEAPADVAPAVEETNAAAADQIEFEESAVVGNGWLSSDDTAAEAVETDFSVAANEESEAAAFSTDESDIVSESSWLSSEGEADFAEAGGYAGVESLTSDGEISGWEGTPTDAAAISAVMPNNVDAARQPTGGTVPNFVIWYSGSVHDEMFEVSKNELPEMAAGSAGNNIIHVNAGYDTYGWLVEFDGGSVMSLEDVRKYQIRNGALPAASGIIRYGANQCRFSGIERILIYQSVRYFSYGA